VRRVALALTVALALPAAASAHVEIKPKRAPAGAAAKLTLEVPNERPTAATDRIDVQLPAGVSSVRGRGLRGWKLATRPRRVILTAPAGQELQGEERGAFRLTATLPQRPGATLVFKVLQTYDSGEVVRWIGPPGTSEPAARLRLTAAAEPEPPAEPAPAPAETPPQPTGEDGGDDGGGGVPIWAGIGLMLVAAAAGTAAARARNRRRMRDWSGE
jgi:uncharacterized protein YcnI